MDFDTKIAIVVREDLQTWQKLNVTAFVISGIAGTQNIIGENYLDKDGAEYLPMSQQPVLVFSANQEEIKRTFTRASSRDIKMSIYIEELFNTFNDEDNRAAVKKFKTNELNIVGIGLRGNKKDIDKVLKGLKLHQ